MTVRVNNENGKKIGSMHLLNPSAHVVPPDSDEPSDPECESCGGHVARDDTHLFCASLGDFGSDPCDVAIRREEQGWPLSDVLNAHEASALGPVLFALNGQPIRADSPRLECGCYVPMDDFSSSGAEPFDELGAPSLRARHDMTTVGLRQFAKPRYGSTPHERKHLECTNHRVFLSDNRLDKSDPDFEKIRARVEGRHKRLVEHRYRRREARAKQAHKWVQ
jgi:hypothetical protein